MRKLTREEQTYQKDVVEYLQDLLEDNQVQDVKLDIVQLAQHTDLTLENICALMCNVEDVELAKEVLSGDYSNIDVYDEVYFNDSYYDLMHQLGLF